MRQRSFKLLCHKQYFRCHCFSSLPEVNKLCTKEIKNHPSVFSSAVSSNKPLAFSVYTGHDFWSHYTKQPISDKLLFWLSNGGFHVKKNKQLVKSLIMCLTNYGQNGCITTGVNFDCNTEKKLTK